MLRGDRLTLGDLGFLIELGAQTLGNLEYENYTCINVLCSSKSRRKPHGITKKRRDRTRRSRELFHAHRLGSFFLRGWNWLEHRGKLQQGENIKVQTEFKQSTARCLGDSDQSWRPGGSSKSVQDWCVEVVSQRRILPVWIFWVSPSQSSLVESTKCVRKVHARGSNF